MSIDILAYGEPLVEFNQQPDRPGHYLQGFGGDTSISASPRRQAPAPAT